MTRDKLIAECKRRSAGGEDVGAIIGYLRTSGCSKIDSIAVLNATYGIGLAEAKRIVHFSPTWADTRASDDKFHEGIEDALTKLHHGDTRDRST
jgi:ribosomal protein L7/L12